MTDLNDEEHRERELGEQQLTFQETKALHRRLTRHAETAAVLLRNEEVRQNVGAEIPAIPHEEDSSESSVLSPPQVKAPK